MPKMTTAEATVAALIAHGVKTIYALPGVHNDPLFDAFFKVGEKMRIVHTRHEQGAAYMALGAALATDQPQAYAVVPGPGLLNTGAALLTAYGMNAPVLAIIGQIPDADIGRGLGHLHEIKDQGGIISRLVDFTALIRRPEEASRLVAEAMKSMRTGRPGPAALECAMDVWGREGQIAKIEPPSPVATPKIDEDAVLAAAKILGGGGAPLHHLRRRRAGRERRSRRTFGNAAGARHGVSPRARCAFQPRSIQRDAAARPRTLGRGRRRARCRHPHALSAAAMGRGRRHQNRPRRCRPRGARACPPAGRGSHRRREAAVAATARRVAEAQSQTRVAQGRNGRAPGEITDFNSKRSRRSSHSCRSCARSCPKTESSSTR